MYPLKRARQTARPTSRFRRNFEESTGARDSTGKSATLSRASTQRLIRSKVNYGRTCSI